MKLALIMLLLCGLAAPASAVNITRATANLNGVSSARGFFNITVRLYLLEGVEWVKYDLKKSMITLDFQPGTTAGTEEIQNTVKAAGYKPGAVKVEQVEMPGEHDKRLGWNRIKRPTAGNAVGRWFQLNF